MVSLFPPVDIDNRCWKCTAYQLRPPGTVPHMVSYPLAIKCDEYIQYIYQHDLITLHD